MHPAGDKAGPEIVHDEPLRSECRNSSAEIVKFLPYLRRYARALLGSQDRGDEYVRVCLEAYLAEPERIDPSSNIRLELFALFHEVWSLVDETFPEAVPDPSDSKVLQGVGRLPPRQRQVLLLVSLEGFSFDEVSRILNASPGEIRAELEAARAELRPRPPSASSSSRTNP